MTADEDDESRDTWIVILVMVVIVIVCLCFLWLLGPLLLQLLIAIVIFIGFIIAAFFEFIQELSNS
jgi:fatty acid desaturase